MLNATYAPYSNYAVGVAILLNDGEIVTGGNIENAAYPVGICAERVAVAKVVSAGRQNDMQALALVTRDGGTPCGMCRQFVSEFAHDLLLYIYRVDGTLVLNCRLSDLLPYNFGPENLA
jgi:cytidine deaminase